MVNKRKTLLSISTFLILILAACNYPRVRVSVAITSHEDEQSVVLNEETRIVSLATASRGIDSVELYIDGELQHTATPVEGNPSEFISDQPWLPEKEGHVEITVVATDIMGKTSKPLTINLQVVLSVSEIEETATPTLTATSEGLAQTQTAQAECTNAATFMQHVTIPINANLTPNANFTKIWRVSNNGSCDWIGYEVFHASGDLLTANSPKALPLVTAGNNADIAVDMVSPSSPGTYTGTWRIRTGDGTVFGPELIITIVVPQPPTNTPVPTATFTPTLTNTSTPTNTPTPTNTATVPPIYVTQIYEQISIPANSNGNTTVTCPAGSVVVSGGFASSDGVLIWDSFRDGNGWRVFGRNTTGSSQLINVYATCLFNTGGSVSHELRQTNVDANGATQLVANCPGSSIVTGGGWIIGATNPIEIYNSSRLDNGWQIWVNNSGGDTPLVNVYAICLSGVSGSTSQSGTTNGEVPANGTLNQITTCPTNTYVTGGGFATNIGVLIYNTTKSGNGWQNFARNTTGTQKLLNTYATCYSP